MSFETTKGLDFFSSILESPIYASTSSSEVVISSSDMEKLDTLGTGTFNVNIFLIIGDTVDTREVVQAEFIKTVVGTVITRTLWTTEATTADHDIGEQIYCGLSYRYLKEIKDILDEIDTDMSELGSTVTELSESLTTLSDEVVDAQEDINTINEQVSNIQKISIHADFSEGDFDSLEVGEAIDVGGTTITPLIYEVPANCGQLVFSFPENNDLGNQKFILLDYSNCSVGSCIILQNSKYVLTEGSSPHGVVSPGYFEGIPATFLYLPINLIIAGGTYDYLSVQIINDLDLGMAAVPSVLIGGIHLVP